MDKKSPEYKAEKQAWDKARNYWRLCHNANATQREYGDYAKAKQRWQAYLKAQKA